MILGPPLEADLWTTNCPLFRPTVASGPQLLSFQILHVFFVLIKYSRDYPHKTKDGAVWCMILFTADDCCLQDQNTCNTFPGSN
jgi:hypothetical protein